MSGAATEREALARSRHLARRKASSRSRSRHSERPAVGHKQLS